MLQGGICLVGLGYRGHFGKEGEQVGGVCRKQIVSPARVVGAPLGNPGRKLGCGGRIGDLVDCKGCLEVLGGEDRSLERLQLGI